MTFAQIQALDITTVHPLILNLLDRLEQCTIGREDLLRCLKDLSSFVIRRSICGESTRPYGRWFPEVIKAIQSNPNENLRSYWLEKGWPDDTAFIPALSEFPIYRRERNKCRLLIESMERHQNPKEEVNPRTLNIEHVLPHSL